MTLEEILKYSGRQALNVVVAMLGIIVLTYFRYDDDFEPKLSWFRRNPEICLGIWLLTVSLFNILETAIKITFSMIK